MGYNFYQMYESRTLALKNRIKLLESKGGNASIVNKLKRELARLDNLKAEKDAEVAEQEASEE